MNEEEIDELQDDSSLEMESIVRAPIKGRSNSRKTTTTSTSTKPTSNVSTTSTSTITKTKFNGKDNSNRVENSVGTKKKGKGKEKEKEKEDVKSTTTISSKKRRISKEQEETVWICPPIGEDGEPILPHKPSTPPIPSIPSLPNISLPPSSIEIPLALHQQIKTSTSSEVAPSSSPSALVQVEFNVEDEDTTTIVEKVKEKEKEIQVDTSISSSTLPLNPITFVSPEVKDQSPPSITTTSSALPIPSTSLLKDLPASKQPFPLPPPLPEKTNDLIYPMISIPKPKVPTHQLIPLTPEGISNALTSLLSHQSNQVKSLTDQLELNEFKLKGKERLHFSLAEKVKGLELRLKELGEEKEKEVEQLEEENLGLKKERDEMRRKLVGMSSEEDDTIIDETDDEED